MFSFVILIKRICIQEKGEYYLPCINNIVFSKIGQELYNTKKWHIPKNLLIAFQYYYVESVYNNIGLGIPICFNNIRSEKMWKTRGPVWGKENVKMVRRLRFHEKKLLKKVDFISWEVDNNLHEVKILKKYYIQKREDYTK